MLILKPVEISANYMGVTMRIPTKAYSYNSKVLWSQITLKATVSSE